jgi:outer membrane immunogenic protein
MTVRLIATALLLFGFLSAAAASDETRPHFGDDALAPDWSGLYAGVHGGYGRSSADWRFPFFQYYNLAPGEGLSADPKGALAGGHLLFNHQFGRFVAGIEGAFAGKTISDERVGGVVADYPDDRFTTRIDSLATLSGRLGIAVDHWLFYAKGGYATAEIRLDALSGPPGAGVAAAIQASQDGRSVGGGIEYMIAPRIVLGLEYQFVKLDAERHASTTTGTMEGLPINIALDDIELHAVTARVSIQLGADLDEPESLK